MHQTPAELVDVSRQTRKDFQKMSGCPRESCAIAGRARARQDRIRKKESYILFAIKKAFKAQSFTEFYPT